MRAFLALADVTQRRQCSGLHLAASSAKQESTLQQARRHHLLHASPADAGAGALRRERVPQARAPIVLAAAIR